MLWTNVCLVEWGITHLREDQFKTIIKHAQGFRYFSVAYIDVKKYRFKGTRSTAHAICNSLCLSHGQTSMRHYLNLSGQLIRNLTFLQGTHHLEYLVLNDCIALKDIFPISFCKNLVFLSLNRIVIHEGELLQSIIRKEIKTLSAVRATFWNFVLKSSTLMFIYLFIYLFILFSIFCYR